MCQGMFAVKRQIVIYLIFLIAGNKCVGDERTPKDGGNHPGNGQRQRSCTPPTKKCKCIV